jgi:hypothetical protein
VRRERAEGERTAETSPGKRELRWREEEREMRASEEVVGGRRETSCEERGRGGAGGKGR